MGTSVSYGSPRNTNWSPVFACYEYDQIPFDRVLNEMWRAADNGETPISDLLNSDVIYKCFEVVKNSRSRENAVEKYVSYILESKTNSFVAELAKRAIVPAFTYDRPVEAWCSSLFIGVTDYLMSRDISGFVGKKYRNKSVTDLVEFKKIIKANAARATSVQKLNVASKKDWASFVKESIGRLKIRNNENR